MSGYLIDTNAISLLSDGRASAEFVEWLNQQRRRETVFLSAMTLLELESGIVKLEVKGQSPAKAARLRSWFRDLRRDVEETVLPIDSKVATIAGELRGRTLARGHNGQLADILIAATAKAHGLTVVTANVRDFEPLGVDCLAPF